MKWSFILAICIFGTSGTAYGNLLGGSKCTWGPSYWCQGIAESSSCSATRHCIDHHWTKPPGPPEDNDDICDLCKEMIKEARDELQSNETQEGLKEVLEGACALIPIKPVADECKKLSDEFIPELIEILSSEMDPNVVCTVAGLCNSEKIDNLLIAYRENKNKNNKNNCQMCRRETRKIAQNVRSAGLVFTTDKLMTMCGHLSSYSDMCRSTVAENEVDIFNLLTRLDNGFCDMIGMCSVDIEEVKELATEHVNEDVECEFCEKIIQHWVDTWTANTTQEELKEVLEALCKRVDDPSRVKRCLHIIDDWYLPFFNYILHEINPHEICEMTGICTGNLLKKVASKQAPISYISLTKTSPKQVFTGGEEAAINGNPNALIGGYFLPTTIVHMNKPGCAICEYVLNKLHEELDGETNEDIISNKVRGFCDTSLPLAVKDQCKNFVSQFEIAIVKLTARGMSGAEMCLRLAACSGNILQQQANLPTAELQILRRNDDNCALCEYALTTVYEMLNDTSDQRAIKNVLESVCDRLPKSLSNECTKMVNEYAVPIIKLIVNNFTPDQICAKIRMCKEPPRPQPPKDDEKCILCEYAITTLDKMIQDKHNQDEVRQALDKVCQLLPNSIEQKCEEFVNTYSEMIIDLLAHDLSPEEVCQALGLCKKQVKQVEERPYCTLCEYALTEVENMLSDQKNEQEIKDALDKICYHLSNPIVHECLNLVNTYTDEIIDLFVKEYTPEEICVELKLCKPKLKPISHDYNDINSIQYVAPIEPKPKKESGYCVLCEYAMEIVDKKILQENNIDFMERLVEYLCSYMPDSVANSCFKFVDKYGEEIMQLVVEEGLDPKLVCRQLGVCQDQLIHDAKPLGGKRCVWGPSYWCASPFHAKACGTTKHCTEHVWN